MQLRELPDTYPGGKGQGGTLRRIINMMPPHDYYVEPFLGSGRILRAKRPAARASFAFEVDPIMIEAWQRVKFPGLVLRSGDGIAGARDCITELLRSGADPSRIVVYFDPPYMMRTRRSQRRVYHREWTDAEHAQFRAWIKMLPVRAIVSHLPCPEYAADLAGWHTFTFNNKIRTGIQIEQVWSNYTPGAELHEYTYVGDNFRERERIKRQVGIIARRFDRLSPAAKAAALLLLQQRENGDA